MALHKKEILDFIVLAVALSFSIFMRHNDFNEGVGVRNLEAPYHVLLTVTALNEGEFKNHRFLPIVSLGKSQDKNIPWGATRPTIQGDYVYTSFTAPGFLIPYFWFKLFNLQPTVKNLAYLNVTLGSVSVLLLYAVILSLLNLNGIVGWSSVISALMGASVGVFSNEALTSQGILYWSQSLYQPIFIGSLVVLIKALQKPDDQKYQLLLMSVTFIGAVIEWTGYIFNFGLIVLFWLTRREKIGYGIIAVQIFAVTLAAGLLTVLHFDLVIDFGITLRALVDRFSARSVDSGSLANLLQGYILSYGMYLIVLALLLVLLATQLLLSGRVKFFKWDEVSPSSRTPSITEKYRFVFIAASVPLLENVLMLQHASEFTFDRLKFTVAAALVISIGFSVASSRARVLIALFLVGAAIHGWQSYKTDLTKYAAWRDANTSNKRLAAAIENQDRDACAVYASNIGVRGYTNLLFHRGIYEWKRPDQVDKLLHRTGACKSIYIEGDVMFPDLPIYTKATVTNVDGLVTVINAGDVK